MTVFFAAPLLLVEHTALIGITTPMEEGNGYNLMMDLKYPDTGKPMFNSIRISLICDECRAKAIVNCPHNTNEIPPWKRDEQRSKLVEGVMRTDVALHMRENAGVVQKQNTSAFNVQNVETLLLSEFDNDNTDYVSNIFICLDTAGGGSSCTAMCVGYYTASYKLVVLGASSVVRKGASPLKPPEGALPPQPPFC